MVPLSDLLNPADECPLSFKASNISSRPPDTGCFTKRPSSSSAYRHDEVMDMEYFAAPTCESQPLSTPLHSGFSPGIVPTDSDGDLFATVSLPQRASPFPLTFDFPDAERERHKPSTGITCSRLSTFRVVQTPLDDREDGLLAIQIPAYRLPSIKSLFPGRIARAQQGLGWCSLYRCANCDWTGRTYTEQCLHACDARNPMASPLLNAVLPFAPSLSSSSCTTPSPSPSPDAEDRRHVGRIVALPGGRGKDHLSRRIDQCTCPICQTVVSRKHDLKRHMRRHDPNAQKFECPEEGCGYANLQRSNLKFHILSVHRRENSELYSGVTQVPLNASSLREAVQHLEREVNDRDSSWDASPLSTDSPTFHRLIEAPASSKGSKEGALRKKPTTPVPSDPCPECGKVMNRQADLKRHMRIHANPRQFQCQVGGCTFSTGRNSTFKIHMDGHSGTQPWSCPDLRCEFRTHDPASLHRHRMRKHGYIPARRRSTAFYIATQAST